MQSAGNPVDERRSGVDRRIGIDRREPSLEEATTLPLEHVFPHARLSESEATERAAAIEAHRRELGSRLGRNVGAVVAAVDYLLNISGDLVSPTIVEHDALELLEHRSVTDPLTGLFNRYHFDATMTREIARCRRYGVPLSLLLVDVDRLKLMNDRWGHHAGDQALSRVAVAIQKSLRGTDPDDPATVSVMYHTVCSIYLSSLFSRTHTCFNSPPGCWIIVRYSPGSLLPGSPNNLNQP